MTGPQADFWPSRVYTGRVLLREHADADSGVARSGGGRFRRAQQDARRHDRRSRGARHVVKANDWNRYVVIARGGTFVHIVNSQLMAVMIDDDPASSNNQPGMFGIEIEATTKVSVRNIWSRKSTDRGI